MTLFWKQIIKIITCMHLKTQHQAKRFMILIFMEPLGLMRVLQTLRSYKINEYINTF